MENEKRKLPIQHTDAGTSYLLDKLQVADGAVLVRSHHIGLPDFIEEKNRDEENVLRDEAVYERVNQTLPELIKLHEEAFRGFVPRTGAPYGVLTGDASLFFRVALSCLADGDHTDTAIHYGDRSADEPVIVLRPAERLAVLIGMPII